jgi:hypothetical protein
MQARFQRYDAAKEASVLIERLARTGQPIFHAAPPDRSEVIAV